MGLAVNLIAAAIVYKVAGTYPATILCALGLLLMLIVFIAGRNKKTPSKENASFAITDSFKQSLSNVGNPVQNANPRATAAIEQHQHFYLQQPPQPTTNRAGASDLEITWKPDEEIYVHTYPPGTTENIQYRLRIANKGAGHLTDVKVWLDKLNPRTSTCVPCILKLMNDNPDQGGPIPTGPYITAFALPPHGERFIDLLLQSPNGSEFWILHTVPKVDRRISAQTYTLTIKVEAANTEPELKSFRLVKAGQLWNMVEINQDYPIDPHRNRVFTDAERIVLVKWLESGKGNNITIVTAGGGPNTQAVSHQITEAFKSAHWLVANSFVGSLNSAFIDNNGSGTVTLDGVYLITKDADQGLVNTVVTAFEQAKPHSLSVNSSPYLESEGALTLYVSYGDGKI
jgi:hypothetical protein